MLGALVVEVDQVVVRPRRIQLGIAVETEALGERPAPFRIVDEVREGPAFQGQLGRIEEVVQKTLTESLPKILDYLAGCLGDDEFMVGGAFSIADISLASAFVNLAIAGEKVDAERWPTMAAYINRVLALPCYAPIVAEELPG